VAARREIAGAATLPLHEDPTWGQTTHARCSAPRIEIAGVQCGAATPLRQTGSVQTLMGLQNQNRIPSPLPTVFWCNPPSHRWHSNRSQGVFK
jgi:hypothetical protein